MRWALRRAGRPVLRNLIDRIDTVLLPFAAELATAAALIGGWLLVTYGITAIVRPRIAWPISIGLLLISLGGMQQVSRIAWFGLYTLTRDEP